MEHNSLEGANDYEREASDSDNIILRCPLRQDIVQYTVVAWYLMGSLPSPTTPNASTHFIQLTHATIELLDNAC